MKSLIAIFFASCLVASAQFGGPGLPYFAMASSSNGPCSLNLPTLPGVITYVDINGIVEDINNTVPPLNTGIVLKWHDLGPNHYNLINTSSIPEPIYFTAGGPTNGPCLTFTNAPSSYTQKGRLTSIFSGSAFVPPITIFMVIKDPSCCNADNTGALFDSMSTNSMQMVTFHPAIGITEMNLVAPSSIALWNGTAGDDSATFGWPYDTWAIVTVQFNGSLSHVYVNGIGPLHTTSLGPNYNPGNNGLLGFILGNSYGTGAFGHTTPFSTPSIVSFCAVLVCQGVDYTAGPLRLQVEEAFGCEFGITVP